MQDVIAVLREQRDRLMADVERIDTAISALSGSSGSSGSSRPSRRSASTKPAGGAGRKRRKMSAAAKKAVSERMKNYWAERKKQSASAANA